MLELANDSHQKVGEMEQPKGKWVRPLPPLISLCAE